ncbi:MAG: hypothetical protein ACYCYP_13705 [Leptospirales bacterium]
MLSWLMRPVKSIVGPMGLLGLLTVSAFSVVNGFPLNAWAASAQTFLNSPGPFYQDVGIMGMGGAAVAVTNDANAVFYNPAGLAQIKSIKFAILDVQGIGSTHLIQAADYAKTGNDTASILQNESALNGDLVNLGVSDFSYFSMPDFAIGVLGNVAASAIPDVPAGTIGTNTPLGSIAARGDLGGVIGLAHSFVNDRVDVGGSLFLMNQYFYANDHVTQGNTQNLSPSSLSNGFGVMGDAGVIGHLFESGLLDWTVGASEQSIGTADFGAGGTLPEMTNAGTGLVITPGYGTLTADLDYDDVFNQTGWGVQNHVCIGLRYNFPEVWGVSAGIYDGQPTFGATVDLWILKIQASYWTEAGISSIPANHVVGAQIALGWL